jgi:hypothetical protein
MQLAIYRCRLCGALEMRPNRQDLKPQWADGVLLNTGFSAVDSFLHECTPSPQDERTIRTHMIAVSGDCTGPLVTRGRCDIVGLTERRHDSRD